MAYTIPEIVTWAKMSQALSARAEAKKQRFDQSNNPDLHIELYSTRRDVEYEYAQDPTSSNLFTMGNYLLSLCGIYLFQAQQLTVGGGSVTPVSPSLAPDAYDFVVSSTSFITNGATTKTFPSNWVGYNILFVRNSITQSIINDGFSTYYSWDRGTATLTLFNGAAMTGQLFQIYPFA